MNTAAIKSFFILSSKWEVHRNGLYQLVQAAERYHHQKDLEGQLCIGQYLKQAPYPFSEVGKYYESLYLIGTGQYETGEKQLEQVVECGPDRYRARAVLSLSASAEFQGKLDEALRLRTICTNMNDPIASIEAQLAIAVIYGISGHHNAAIKSIERFLPYAKYTHPTTYGEYLNSYAVELSEVGRITEAQNVVSTILASPYISYYKSWQETGREIHLKSQPASRLFISSNKLAQNVIDLPVSENRVVQSPPTRPAKVFSLPDWKKKMGKKPNGNEKIEEVGNMDEKDLMVKLLYLATDERLNEKKLRKLVEYALQVLSEPSED